MNLPTVLRLSPPRHEWPNVRLNSTDREIREVLCESRTLPEESYVVNFVATDMLRRMPERVAHAIRLSAILAVLTPLILSASLTYWVKPARPAETFIVLSALSLFVCKRAFTRLAADLLLMWYKSANPRWMKIRPKPVGYEEDPDAPSGEDPIEPWELEPANRHPLFR
jgi:hypothetical protein